MESLKSSSPPLNNVLLMSKMGRLSKSRVHEITFETMKPKVILFRMTFQLEIPYLGKRTDLSLFYQNRGGNNAV